MCTRPRGARWRGSPRRAARARARRHARFFALARLPPGARVLDVGCGALGLRGLEPGLDITGVDIVARPGYPGPFVQADAAEGLPFADGEFDLAYCSSVIEHVPPARREAFAAELRRVARGWYVQTPAYSLPDRAALATARGALAAAALRRAYWRLGAAGGWEEIALLRRGELERLFGPARAERFGPLAKSWVCVRPAPALAGERLMSLLRPLMTRNSSSTIPTRAEAVHAVQRDPPSAQLLGHRPQHVAAVERQEREQVDDGEHQRDEAEEHERVAGTGRDRFVGRLR